MLRQTKKYSKIFHVTAVSKGTPFDTLKHFKPRILRGFIPLF